MLEAIAKSRLDYAVTLQQRGFLPTWYIDHLQQLQRHGVSFVVSDASGHGAEVYGTAAVAPGAPDEYSHNARVIKAAICAGMSQNLASNGGFIVSCVVSRTLVV